MISEVDDHGDVISWMREVTPLARTAFTKAMDQLTARNPCLKVWWS